MKIISEHDYRIITACKKNDNLTSLITYLKEYLSFNEITEEVIYNSLANTLFNILEPIMIKKIYTDELNQIYFQKTINGNPTLRYKDFISIIYKTFLLLPLRGEKDFYVINVNNAIYRYQEYDNYLKEKENKQKQLQK